jgi:hypothetical protein
MTLFDKNEHDWPRILGKAVLLASIQVSIASVEMSSKYSVINFSKDAETLQNAANALTSYLVIGLFWAIGTCMIMYSSSGIRGLSAGIVTNGVMIAWVYVSYMKAFKTASNKYNIPMPTLFKSIV